MSKSVNGHFPNQGNVLGEVKKRIRKRLLDSKDISSGELEDCVNELLQETVDRYLRHAKDPDANIRNPKSYILEIARNACTEFLKQRKKKRMRELPLPDAQEREDSCSLELISDERDQPEQVLLQKECLNHLFSSISQLHPRFQRVIRLKAEGVESMEIAQQTAMSPATVDKYLRDGRKELRQLLILSERSK